MRSVKDQVLAVSLLDLQDTGVSYLLKVEMMYNGHPTFLWQKVAPIIVGWFTSRTWKGNIKWYTKMPKLLCNFIVYT